MIAYLACPYTHPDAEVRQQRFEAANHAAARLMRNGLHVFSPISHSHPIALAGDLPLSWDFWRDYSLEMVAKCERVIVLKLDGWEQSIGVRAELRQANLYRVPVEYLEPTL